MTFFEHSPLLQALPNVRHAFFTADGSRDTCAVQLGASQLIRVHQIHSADVVMVPSGGWDESVSALPQGDAMVARQSDQALAIATADCGPVLFADQASGVIAAAHAGWRGAVSGVLDNTISQMVLSGAKRNQITAVLGPCIHQDSYQVGQDVVDAFMMKDAAAHRYFVSDHSETGDISRYRFDLPAFILDRLSALEVAHVGWVAHDTYTDARFDSYRRATHTGQDTKGRQLSVIRLVSD